MLRNLAVITVFTILTFNATAQKVVEPKNVSSEWSAPYQPFRIVGNLYYVGTYDLACYLITTPKGNILINTGLASSASVIEGNIKSLGFKFSDTKILLTTQAHYDHMGAMAAIKKVTGARLMLDEKDAEVAADGGKTDYALGHGESTYEPVKADCLLHDRDTVTLGNMKIALLHHPGHTKGSCSYIFNVRDEKKSYTVLIANLPTIVTEKNFSDIPSYPSITKDYFYTLTALKKQPFDIWLSSHANQFGLHDKHKPGDAYNPESFATHKDYDEAINNLQKAFDEKVGGK